MHILKILSEKYRQYQIFVFYADSRFFVQDRHIDEWHTSFLLHSSYIFLITACIIL